MVYKTKGTCSQYINVELKDGVVESVEFLGGCNGNTQGIAKLVKGMEAEKVIELLAGTDCGGRGTSCPDQLSKALRMALDAQA